MSTMTDLVTGHTALDKADIDHLHRLAGDWHLIADLSFADLLLWVAIGPDRYLCVAQVRPTTAPTTYTEDQVGRFVGTAEMPQLSVAATEGRIWREGDPVWQGDVPVRHEAVPVSREGRVIAVVGRDTNLAAARVPSHLELSYLESAAALCQMVADGSFPLPVSSGEASDAPRIGDGVVRLDAAGRVAYASPNAMSACRRLGVLGNLQNVRLADVVHRLADDALAGGEAAAVVEAALTGKSSGRVELEAHGAAVVLRALPLLPGGEPAGVLVVLRDVTEVRRRDRQLLSKDATIREIHHRVKNNLQTVAALLRLQARRVDSVQARAALTESVRRVSSIALVHETLSASVDETVEFDGIVDRVLSMVGDLTAPQSRVRVRREGTFGVLSSQVATPLVMVLTELLQNAVEHGFPRGRCGEVIVAARAAADLLRVTVSDDGAGLPAGFSLENSDRLGLQIVRTLVGAELGGEIALREGAGGGTQALLWLPLRPRSS
ncbi:MAG: sensor histidine kinase [Actinomycetota bacterium]|nr:sensor histidine kinase [Actinomycetota bacterium]